MGLLRGAWGGVSEFYRLCLEQVVKPVPTNSDLDVLRLDVDPVDERHENGSDDVWGKRRKLL